MLSYDFNSLSGAATACPAGEDDKSSIVLGVLGDILDIPWGSVGKKGVQA